MQLEGYGEIIGGSERIHDYDELKERIVESGLNLDAYEWYLDLRKYGSDRTLIWLRLGAVAWFSGVQHVRETSPFQTQPSIPNTRRR